MDKQFLSHCIGYKETGIDLPMFVSLPSEDGLNGLCKLSNKVCHPDDTGWKHQHQLGACGSLHTDLPNQDVRERGPGKLH